MVCIRSKSGVSFADPSKDPPPQQGIASSFEHCDDWHLVMTGQFGVFDPSKDLTPTRNRLESRTLRLASCHDWSARRVRAGDTTKQHHEKGSEDRRQARGQSFSLRLTQKANFWKTTRPLAATEKQDSSGPCGRLSARERPDHRTKEPIGTRGRPTRTNHLPRRKSNGHGHTGRNEKKKKKRSETKGKKQHVLIENRGCRPAASRNDSRLSLRNE